MKVNTTNLTKPTTILSKKQQERKKWLLEQSDTKVNKNYVQVLAYLDELEQLGGLSHSEMFDLLDRRVVVYRSRLNISKAMESCEQLLKLFEVIAPSEAQKVMLLEHKVGLNVIKGAFQQTLDEAKDFLPEIEQKTIPELNVLHGDIYLRLGVAASRLSKLDSAIQYYEKATEIFDFHDDVSGKANVQHDMGAVLAENGRIDESHDYFMESLNFYTEINATANMAMACNSLGNVYSCQNKGAKAEAFYNKALELSRKENMNNMVLHTLSNLGYYYLNMKNYEAYFALEDEMVDCLNQTGEENKQASFFYQTNSRAYLEYGDYEKAMHWLNKAEAIEKISNETKSLANIEKQKMHIYRAKGNLEQALIHYDKYTALHEEVQEQAKQNALQEYEAKFQNTKKEKAIQALKLEQVSLKLHSLRAQMNPHFMFNALNAINSFISPETIDKSKELIVSFARIMRTNLDYSEKDTISLDQEIQFIKDYLLLEQSRMQSNMLFDLYVPNDLDTDFIDIPSMLLQPYVENAVKHGLAGRKDGKIDIAFQEENDFLTVTVTDNGQGRTKAAEAKKREEAAYGKSYESKSTSIAQKRLQLINESAQEKVKVHYEDLVNKQGKAAGTRVHIRIPI